MQAVKNDPFSSIREIKREINDQHPSVTVGYWQVLGILRRNRLLSRRARFRFSRNKF